MKRVIKLLFSRLGAAAVTVLVELALVLTLLLRLSAYSVWFFVFLIVINFLALVAVVNDDGNPEYKLTWMGVILLIPLLGLVLYVLFRRHKMSKREIVRLSEMRREIAEDAMERDDFSSLGKTDGAAAGKAMSLIGIDETAAVYTSTSSKYYPSGKEMFEDMLRDLAAAEKYVFLEYFIVADGKMWERIYEVLKQKVSSGVEVRVIYDDIGCIGKAPRDFDKGLKDDGISCLRFAPVSADLRNMRRNNNRDHRKLCIIDGRVGYTGGINIADEYIGESVRYGVWKDGGVRLIGDAVLGMVRLFLEIWELSSVGKRSSAEYFNTGDSFTSDGGFYIPFGSGPYPMYKNHSGKRAILDIVNQAQRYVYIMTPYLIIDYDLTDALLGAVCRGVDVRIITPGIPDKPIVKVMTKGAYPHLVAGGVGIYEFTPGFLHSKILVSDDLYALVGTINLDYRSLVHHFEDAVWIYSSPTVCDIRRDFMDTVAESHHITAEEARLGPLEWIVRCLIRLFAPLF